MPHESQQDQQQQQQQQLGAGPPGGGYGGGFGGQTAAYGQQQQQAQQQQQQMVVPVMAGLGVAPEPVIATRLVLAPSQAVVLSQDKLDQVKMVSRVLLVAAAGLGWVGVAFGCALLAAQQARLPPLNRRPAASPNHRPPAHPGCAAGRRHQ